MCRNTGEEHGLHLEHRAFRAPAGERLGIITIKDLIGFDHDAFWRDRLKHVYRVNEGVLGRRLRNKRHGTRTQKQRVVRQRWGRCRPVNVDARSGHFEMLTCDGVQGLVDEYGLAFVRPCLERIVVTCESDFACQLADENSSMKPGISCNVEHFGDAYYRGEGERGGLSMSPE